MTQVPPAAADTAPVAPSSSPTVAADPLPTVQINGVVWSQVVVGNRVYATGDFTSARPAGSPAGTNEIPRSYVLAYDLTTGNLITSWAPALNAQGLAIAASADGSKIYVGGDFTLVNGVTRNRVVALDASTGAVLPFSASLNARVRALTESNGVLYAGGIFSTSSGQPRTRLAAFSASTGALLDWTPTADAEVMAITAPAGSGKVVVGGRFTLLNGLANYGLGALDAATAATLAWPANAVVRNAGDAAAINSLSTDGTRVFGTGYTFGSGGNLENTFSTDTNGNLNWVVGCRGDTYSSAPLNGNVYIVGHAHDCSQIGAFPQTNPWTYQRAIAFTADPGTHGETNLSGNFTGRPAPEMLHWLPTLDVGTYTGQSQAAWSVAGNGQYVSLGGEFPRVNWIGQQGLVRFAVKDLSTNKEGPQSADELTVTAQQVGTGALRVSWPASWDRDNRRLTYEVLRDGVVVGRVNADSTWWDRPTVAFTDTSVPPGASVTYRIRAKDATNAITGPALTTSGPPAARAAGNYADNVRADGAMSYWRLGESSGSTSYDWTGGRDLTVGTVTRGAVGAVVGDPDTATTFPGGTNGVPAATKVRQLAPQYFSAEAWFRTTSTAGGKILGFGNSTSGDSSTADRHVYMGNDGRLNFGVLQNGTGRTITTAGAFNNGQWHHVVATMGDAGMQLFVDGASVGTRTDTTFGQMYWGYWRVAGDAIGAQFPNRPQRSRLTGTVDEVAVYPVVLDAAKVLRHYQLGQAINQAPVGGFTWTANNLAASFDGSGSSDPDGTVASYSWNFGDGSTGTGSSVQHTYGAGGTYSVTLTVTDDKGATGSVTKSVAVVANQPPTAAFTSSVTDLSAAFNGTGSTDADGTITSYAWDFGDGTTGTGASAQHSYGAAGTFTVTLTVTDDDGAIGTATGSVTVASPATGTSLAEDTFSRTVSSGWGTADKGGAWSGGSTTASVSSGSGRVSLGAGATATMRLASVASPDSDVRERAWLESMPTGGGAYLSTIVRGTAGGDYRCKIRVMATGAVQVQLFKMVGSTETALNTAATVSGLTYTAGAPLVIRAQATGAAPTTLRVKVWLDGAAEPGTWQQTVTDSTDGLQVAGNIGLVTYLSASATAPVVARYDDLVASRP
jgi:PKD repeat protein